MITITPAAATQILLSAKQNDSEGFPLRLAAKFNEDGSVHYGMGFDERGLDEDVQVKSEGVSIVIEASSASILKGTEIDYVEMDGGQFEFIFKNPNDPNYSTKS